MRPSPHVRDRQPPPVVRAVTGVLLGLVVGAVAALATPRRPAGGPDPADGAGEPVAHVP